MASTNDTIAPTPTGTTPATRQSPWSYIPTLYFAEGVPYILINSVSVILYTRLGVDNATMAFWTSWLYLPWVIKMFWGPLVDMVSTKRRWILGTQIGLFAVFAFVSFALGMQQFFAASLAGFIVGAFISATQDISVDGFYMLALDKPQQAFFVGIRSTFYRVAMIFGSGFLVYTAGKLEELSAKVVPQEAFPRLLHTIVTTLGLELGNKTQAWSLVFGTAGILFLCLCLYHAVMLPYPAEDVPSGSGNKGAPGSGAAEASGNSAGAAASGNAAGVAAAEEKVSFSEAIISYFRQDRIVTILSFILLYRFGEAMLVKLASPFLLAPAEKGGLGLLTEDVGIAYGTIGLLSLVVGGILGGMAISRFGFRKCIWPMALAMNVPDLFYVYMAYAQPAKLFAYPLIAIEQLGYGFGFTAFTVYLMYVSQGRYKTSHFAISTGIMALGMMLPGFVSGYLQQNLGYYQFFIVVCLATIPGFVTIPFVLRDPRTEEKPSEG
jgi:PAT family beta-lactamase induction signal transducer AmpG